jgi:hypothetical protein
VQPVREVALERHIVPLAYFFRIQMKDDREGVKFVKAWSYVAVFDVSQPA